MPKAESGKRFAILGAAGYIAPRHMAAIKSVGGKIVATMDPSDSVGILDKYDYNIDHFTEFERFDRHLNLLQRKGQGVDYISICSPNYLHDSHIRFALRSGANAICEKPLVINPWNLDGLSKLEEETGRRVYNILQLRHHPQLISLKRSMEYIDRYPLVCLTYTTPRGNWYQYSWKGIKEKSGGMLINIGIHIFDIMIWIFGKPTRSTVIFLEDTRARGTMQLSLAEIDWFLGTKPISGYSRIFSIDDKKIDFSSGFTDLHKTVYKNIMHGNGYGIEDARPAIELVHSIRNSHAS